MLPCREIQRIHCRFFKYVTKLTERSYGSISININVKRTKLVLSRCNKLSSSMCRTRSRKHVSHSSTETAVEKNECPSREVDDDDDDDLPTSSRLRNALYPHTDDIVINRLKSSNSLKELFATIEQHSPATRQHLAQAVLTYRDLIESKDERISSNSSNNDGSNDALLVSNRQLDNLIKSILLASNRMNSDELSSCILHLYECGISQHVLRELIQTYEHLARRSNDEQLSVRSIARFAIAVREFDNIWSLFTLSNIAPILYRKLDACDDYDRFRHVIISFQRCTALLNESTIVKFVSKCSILLAKQDNVDAETRRSRCVLKACIFLTDLRSHRRDVKLAMVKELLLSLRGSVKYLHFLDLVFLHKIMLWLQEPRELFNEVHEHTFDARCEHRDSTNIANNSFFNCEMPEMRSASLEEWLRHMFNNYSTKPLTFSEFTRQKKFFHAMLLNAETKFSHRYGDVYWNRLVSLIDKFPSLQSDDKLLWVALRYLDFSRKKRYRNTAFETAMLSKLNEIFKDDGKMIYKPASFVTIALSIVYFSKSRVKFTNDTWQRVSKCIALLNVFENKTASFILNMIVRTTDRPRKLSSLWQYYMNILSSLNDNTLAYLSSHNEITGDVVNILFQAYIYRDCVKDSIIFKQICDRLNNIAADELCSRTIRNATRNLFRCSHLEAQYVNKIVDYCIKEKEIVNSHLATFVLHYLFLFGYVPENCDAFVRTTLELVDRSIEHVSRVRLVEAALALCYFNELPSHLTDVIFDVKFLNDWEEELKRTTSAVTSRRHEFMELNRTVCVEYPHRDIPWFHNNYCRERLLLESRHQNSFLDDVCNVLKRMVNVNRSVVENSLSPYYHKIDILFHTDRRGEPVDPNLCNAANLRRTAILLLENETSPASYYLGKGAMQLKVRQLEMLDYNVVAIDKRVWFSMRMSEPLAKENYLCSRIWNKSNNGIESEN